jgi:hypothetical protein
MPDDEPSRQLATRRANLAKARALPKAIRYRMTEKRLAACRRNLAKARAVPREIRFRPTERRLAANRANLVKARERARAEGATLRHGMSCRTLEASLAGAGETLDALKAQFKRFELLFEPEDGFEAALVHGLAEASWRRRRAFRLVARRERRKLAQVLSLFASRRRAREAGAASGARVLTGGAGGAPQQPEAQAFGAEPAPVERWIQEARRVAEARECVLRVLGVFYECATLWKNVLILNRRITCLVHLLLTLKDIPHAGLNLTGLGERTLAKVLSQPRPTLGNPLLAPSRLLPGSKSGTAGRRRSRPPRGPACPAALEETRLDGPEAWREHFTAALGALDEEEREMVARIAQAAWERLELLRKRAQKEAEELEHWLSAPAPGARRAWMGMAGVQAACTFNLEPAFMEEAEKLQRQIGGWLEKLLVTRSRKLDPVRWLDSAGESGREGWTAAITGGGLGVSA